MDKCHSYNADIGTVREVTLPAPSWSEREWISVDYCIAEVIQHLWDNGIVTLGSCCGHGGKIDSGKKLPSIILGQGIKNYAKIKEIIAEKDKRTYTLLQWKLVQADRVKGISN